MDQDIGSKFYSYMEGMLKFEHLVVDAQSEGLTTSPALEALTNGAVAEPQKFLSNKRIMFRIQNLLRTLFSIKLFTHIIQPSLLSSYYVKFST